MDKYEGIYEFVSKYQDGLARLHVSRTKRGLNIGGKFRHYSYTPVGENRFESTEPVDRVSVTFEMEMGDVISLRFESGEEIFNAKKMAAN